MKKITFLIGLFLIPFLSYGQGQFLSVCDRTPQVRDAIMEKIAKIDPSIECSDDDLLIQLLPEIKTLWVQGDRGIFSLFGNTITSLKIGDFSGLTSLTDLRLDNNDLDSLHKDIFSGLTSLTDLHLGNNDLDSLHKDIFSGLTSLEFLFIENNELASLPRDVFSGLTSLRFLYLYGNKFTRDSLPKGIFDPLTSLKSLNGQAIRRTLNKSQRVSVCHSLNLCGVPLS